jgi:hypothetical protein
MKQRCLGCKQITTESHARYAQLCLACRNLNATKRNQTMDMTGRTAIVTGARIKIGYAVALKLLRAGATVLTTTRFPNNAAQHFSQEPDFEQWKTRLKIYGLELRHLASVEQFTQHVRHHYQHLEVIINNAAQTVRRPPVFYKHLMPLAACELPKDLRLLLAPCPEAITPYSESLINLPSHFSSAQFSQIPPA